MAMSGQLHDPAALPLGKKPRLPVCSRLGGPAVSVDSLVSGTRQPITSWTLGLLPWQPVCFDYKILVSVYIILAYFLFRLKRG
jgi:hypothetical protein